MQESPAVIRVLLALRLPISAELYAQALDRTAGIQVAACVANVREALEAAKMTAVNVALISPTLKDGPLSGLRAVELIYEARPDIRSVILLESDECDITAAFRAGAKGVFSIASGTFKSLCRCVQQVNAGQVWANSSQLREVLEAFSRKAPRQVVNANGRGLLTNREGEVVRLVEEGMTNKQISQKLGLSAYTVRNNLFRIFDKLGVSTRVELALYATNHARIPHCEERLLRKEIASESPSQMSLVTA